MKKRMICVVVLIFCLSCMLLLSSCDEKNELGQQSTNEEVTPGDDQTSKKDITGISFSNLEVTYDGEEHSLAVSGTLPEGVSVTYNNNKATDAGTYNATATLSGEGYKTATLSATLVIKKATVTGITFSDKTVTEDGTEHSVLVEGTLPTGVTVTYENNKGSRQGTYQATATVTGANYEELVLHAVLKIKPDLTRLAAEVIENVLTIPDIWSFFPEALSPEELGYLSAPNTDFSNAFVSTQSIPKRVIGKQMNVVYDAIDNTQTVFAALRAAYGSAEAITTLYQGFINQNPNDYATYADTVGAIRFQITLDGGSYTLLLDIGTASLELSYDIQEGVCYGRIQLTNANALKYEMADNYLKISCSLVGLSLHQLEFSRENDTVVGYLYEYLGTEGTNLKTSALIQIDSVCTTIISNKKESDDLVVDGAVEIYSNQTGELIGMHVRESGLGTDYDTRWFALSAFHGFDSVKMVAERNGLNAHTVYINGSQDPVKTKTVSFINASRRFDIEMRSVYVYVWNQTKESYEKQAVEIPILFIQSDFVESFGADFLEKNDGRGVSTEPTLNLNALINTYVSNAYITLLPGYLEIKDLVPYGSIVAYIGEKNAFFESTNS